jgi:hypothetical protein
LACAGSVRQDRNVARFRGKGRTSADAAYFKILDKHAGFRAIERRLKAFEPSQASRRPHGVEKCYEMYRLSEGGY